jgi:hypothetical protein
MVTVLRRLLRLLLPRRREDHSLAREDDALDAWLDEDEIDATGL